jgi:hypothetical protein
MSSEASLDPDLRLTLLPGARELLAAHARELPQRDDLCGAFCGALALSAAGLRSVPVGGGSGGGAVTEHGGVGEPLDQDAVALAADSVVGAHTDPAILPFDERGRRDYRLAIPTVEDATVSGTTAAGLARAIERLSAARLAAIPLSGPWNATTLDGLFDLVAAFERPVTLLANLATHHLWGSHPRLDRLFAYLFEGEQSGPPPDWDVGHFACVFGRLRGPRGNLYGLADTDPSLGAGGVHLQPRERLAAAIERRDMPAGGVLAIVAAEDVPALRSGADTLGLVQELWDNGTVTPGASAPAGAPGGAATGAGTAAATTLDGASAP